ncbi:hypothetical protein LOTGIDRAFT_170637 [Lottia gigantea]|uniref:Uncharacterized protein n=1 Tax=Lottia gigantea TaxID=225164 RepID=V4CQ20_LOTGI|nr:hypothetical protein LOTGIDRAFT_170637 [Lottia gigantea]ESP04545.1 hypothetical protein LOTGIDRAFT_170637 [Lottia gigantea]
MAIGCWCCCSRDSVDTIDTYHHPLVDTVNQQTTTDVRHANTTVAGKAINSTTGRPTPSLPQNSTSTSSSISSKESIGNAPTKAKRISEMSKGKDNKARPLPIPKNIKPISCKNNKMLIRPLPIPPITKLNAPSTNYTKKEGRSSLPPTRQHTSTKYVSSSKEEENKTENRCLQEKQNPSILPKGVRKKEKKDRQSKEKESLRRASTRERPHQSRQTSTDNVRSTEITNNATRVVLRGFDENGVECTIVNDVYIPKLDLSWLDEDGKPVPVKPKEKRRIIKNRILRAKRKRVKQKALERERNQQGTKVEENPSIATSEVVNITPVKETCNSTWTLLEDPLSSANETPKNDVDEQRMGMRDNPEKDDKSKGAKDEGERYTEKGRRWSKYDRKREDIDPSKLHSLQASVVDRYYKDFLTKYEAKQRKKNKNQESAARNVDEEAEGQRKTRNNTHGISKEEDEMGSGQQDRKERSVVGEETEDNGVLEVEVNSNRKRRENYGQNNNAIKGFNKEYPDKKFNHEKVQHTDYSVFLADSAITTVQKNTEAKRAAEEKMEAAIMETGSSEGVNAL